MWVLTHSFLFSSNRACTFSATENCSWSNPSSGKALFGAYCLRIRTTNDWATKFTCAARTTQTPFPKSVLKPTLNGSSTVDVTSPVTAEWSPVATRASSPATPAAMTRCAATPPVPRNSRVANTFARTAAATCVGRAISARVVKVVVEEEETRGNSESKHSVAVLILVPPCLFFSLYWHFFFRSL